MGEFVSLSELAAGITPNLVSVRNWGDATFISLPMVYPSGSFVAIRLTHAPQGIRVSDSGFAYREAESFGAERSFSRTAQSIAEEYGVEVAKRSVYVDVPFNQVERAIFDVSGASKIIAERIVSKSLKESEATISEALIARLDKIFPQSVQAEGKITGASNTEWEVTALAKVDGKPAVFQAVSNYPVSVFKASTAFHDLAALEHAPALVSVVSSKAEMGKNYSLLAQAGRVIEIGQTDQAFLRAAA